MSESSASSAFGGRIFRDRRGTIKGGPGAGISLAAMRPGESGRIVGVDSTDARLLQKLLAMAMLPGSEIRVDMTFPAFVVRVGHARVALDRSVAGKIRAERLSSARSDEGGSRGEPPGDGPRPRRGSCRGRRRYRGLCRGRSR